MTATAHELPAWECYGLLSDHGMGRMCLVDGGYPIAVPINYRVLERCRTTAARRAHAAELDGRALPRPCALEVDDIDLGQGSGLERHRPRRGRAGARRPSAARSRADRGRQPQPLAGDRRRRDQRATLRRRRCRRRLLGGMAAHMSEQRLVGLERAARTLLGPSTSAASASSTTTATRRAAGQLRGHRRRRRPGELGIAIRTRPGNVLDRPGRPACLEIDGVDPGHDAGWSVLVAGCCGHSSPPTRPTRIRCSPIGRDAWLLLEPTAITGAGRRPRAALGVLLRRISLEEVFGPVGGAAVLSPGHR